MTILNNLDKHIATLYFSILVNYIATTQSAETDGGTQRPPSFGFAERGARGFHEDALHILTKTALSVTILTIPKTQPQSGYNVFSVIRLLFWEV